ncbi:hypothetical protein D9758_003415 [Tetrapyrgos nigripes]|uniref:NADP-dependent oxidoreductase domain-containing protein n=1 Tax=Tetrapyrgos nigripes TaxID=182062 RepID=A0A8H5GVA5_9AGAR|nr:hypothetical protein D9758_003415 [Tetrapyrgos nigripes]
MNENETVEFRQMFARDYRGCLRSRMFREEDRQSYGVAVGAILDDIAQSYRNEAEAGQAIRDNFYSQQSQESRRIIRRLVSHSSSVPDILTSWKQMSIGVSNFGVDDLAKLLAAAEIKPAANQILLHPYVYTTQAPIIEYAKARDIVIEGYSSLIPITQRPGGPVDAPVTKIASRLGVTPDQVLMA